jgi:hypothetical protein
MSLNIWFVPSNTNHIAKTIPLLQRMREVGHDVKLICLDNLLDPLNHTFEQIKKLDFQYEKIPAGSFRSDCSLILNFTRITRSLYHALQVRKLPAVFRSFLEDRRQRPDALIFGSDTDSLERSFVRTAQSLGIPSILVADGIFLPNNPRYPDGIFKKFRHKFVIWISRF